MISFFEFEEKYLEECTNLYVDTFNAPPWNDHWDYDSVYNRLKDIYQTPGFLGLIAYEEEKIIAAVLGNMEHWYEGKMYNLKEMFVQKDLRGKGIGSQLLNEFNEWLKKKGVTSIWLFTMEGDMTEDFYKKNGYKKIDKMVMMSRDI